MRGISARNAGFPTFIAPAGRQSIWRKICLTQITSDPKMVVYNPLPIVDIRQLGGYDFRN